MSHLPLSLPSKRENRILLAASLLLAISGAQIPAYAAPSGVATPTPALDALSDPSEGTFVTSPASSSGIELQSPPPASAFSTDPKVLVRQAEQEALNAQDDANEDLARKERDYNAASFNKAASGLLPLAPDQIREFMHRLQQTQDASQFPYEGPPKGITRVESISLEPGIDPPVVNLSSGYVTTITIVDATGEPWPILDVGIGGNFEVSPTPAGTHVIRLMPLTRVASGDLSVLLKNLPTPVILRLSAGGPSVDLRYDAHIGKFGPAAKPQIVENYRPEAGDETLAMILENAPPSGAKRLKIGGLDARTKAWAVDDRVYIRSPLALLSPAWNASMSSADGTSVYEIGSAPVLLMSDNGAVVRAQIMRDEEHDR